MPKVNVKDKRKQQLIDANMASVAKRGLVDTTIAHVSDGANMSRGIVNFYFTSKEKMMQETLVFLIQEQNACWQEALTASAKQEPLARIEEVLRALMGDKLCSARRLAVWSAFIGHAGTHVGYAKLIRTADDVFTKQMKNIWQEAGADAKQAESRARQMLALIRGHHIMTFLNADSGKPSQFVSLWIESLRGWSGEGVAPVKSAKVVQQIAPAKPKKVPASKTLAGQLDFGDLFAKQ